MTHKKLWNVLGRVFIALALTVTSAAFEVTAQGTRFVTHWDTDVEGDNVETARNQIKLPLSSSGTYDFVVAWGDGNEDRIRAHDQAELTHTYASKGEYEVTITGICEGFGFGYDYTLGRGTGDCAKLLDVSQWGPVKLHNEGYQFTRCTNLSGFSAPDVPDLSNVTDMRGMFWKAALFNQDIGSWDEDDLNTRDFIETIRDCYSNYSEKKDKSKHSEILSSLSSYLNKTDWTTSDWEDYDWYNWEGWEEEA